MRNSCKKALNTLLMTSCLSLCAINPSYALSAQPAQAQKATTVSSPSASQNEPKSTPLHNENTNFRFRILQDAKLDMVGGQWKTIEDQFGFIWFAGSGGIARYDGYDLKVYRHDPKDPQSLSGNYVSDLELDKKGNLWVTTRWGLNRYDYASDTFERFEHDPNDDNTIAHNYVWNVTADSRGGLWLGTGGGLDYFTPKNGQFTHYKHDAANPNSLAANSVWTVYEDKQGIIWIGTEKNGLNSFDQQTNTFTHYPSIPQDPTTLSHFSVLAIYEDNENTLWVGTNDGLNRLNRKTGKFKRYSNDPSNPKSISGNIVRGILQDQKGRLWFATDGSGVSVYNASSDDFKQYKHGENSTNGLLNNKTRSIYEDSSGGLWIGHFPAGISVLDQYATAFSNYQHNPANPNSLGNSDVLSAIEDKSGNLWIGTEQGLNYLDRRTGKITRYNHAPEDPTSLQANPVLYVWEDSQANIWVGTWGGGMSRFESKTGTFKRYPALNGKEARTFFEDSSGFLWIGTENGISRYDAKNNRFKHYTHNPDDSTTLLRLGVNAIFEDSNQNFWVGSDTGLTLMDRAAGTFTRYTHNPDNPRGIGPGYITSITEDSAGYLWLGMGADGVNRLNSKTMQFRVFRSEHGLADDITGGVVEDRSGDLWISTGSGLSRFNPEKEEFISNYTIEHGLPGNLYKRPAALLSSQGELIFGSTKGLTIFKPDNIAENTTIPPVVITDFQIFYKPVELGTKGSPLKEKITLTKELTLTHKQSVFSFEFVSLNYNMPEKNQYSYKLEGFDKEWVFGDARRTASYTNLDAGEYIFRVRGSNNEGLWNNEGTHINIQILPPWWKTGWAYTLYTLTLLGIILKFVHSQQQKRRAVEEQNRILEVKVSERTGELQKKNNDIQDMLSNMRQGLFTIETDGTIHPEYSTYLESIFKKDNLAGKDAYTLLFTGAQVGSNELNQVKEGIDSIIGEDELNFTINSHILISDYETIISDNLKSLSLDWNAIVDADDIVQKLMVSVRDVTLLKQMENEAASKKRELDIVSQLLNLPSSKYQKFISTTIDFLNDNEELIKINTTMEDNIVSELFRNMHTIKGNCRTYGFTHFSDVVHEVETLYSRLKKGDSEWNQKALLSDIAAVRETLAEYEHIYTSVLGRQPSDNVRDGSGFWMNEETAQRMNKNIEQIIIDIPSEAHQQSLNDLKRVLEQGISSTLEEALEDVIDSLPSIAEQLDKEAPTVNTNGDGIRIKNEHLETINNVFAHLLRNCLDHGIETAAQRIEKGKSAAGTIKVIGRNKNQKIFFMVEDDGRGLNIQRLYAIGVKQGRWQVGDTIATRTIGDMIFESGVSTKETVSDISGRGVGMDAVRAFIRKLGGDVYIEPTGEQAVEIETGKVEFTSVKFIIELPESICLTSVV